MKAKGIILGLAAVWFLSSCEGFEIDGLFEDVGVGFNTDYYDVEVVIPPTPAGIEVSLTAPMKIDIEELLAENGYEGSTVNTITVIDAALEVQENSNLKTLDPVNAINTAIATAQLPEATIASCVNDSIGASYIDMDTPETDLVDYLETGDYNLITSGSLKDNVTDTLRIRAKYRYHISINLNTTKE